MQWRLVRIYCIALIGKLKDGGTKAFCASFILMSSAIKVLKDTPCKDTLGGSRSSLCWLLSHVGTLIKLQKPRQPTLQPSGFSFHGRIWQRTIGWLYMYRVAYQCWYLTVIR